MPPMSWHPAVAASTERAAARGRSRRFVVAVAEALEARNLEIAYCMADPAERRRAVRTRGQHPCGHDGAVPLWGSAKPGGPQPPTMPGKLTGGLDAGLLPASTGAQHVIPGSTYVGFESLPAPPVEALSTALPT